MKKIWKYFLESTIKNLTFISIWLICSALIFKNDITLSRFVSYLIIFYVLDFGLLLASKVSKMVFGGTKNDR